MTGIISIVLGILYLIGMMQIEPAAIGHPHAPIYFPSALGLGMIGLGIAQLIKDKKISIHQYLNDETIPMILKTAGIIIIYAVLFVPAGYVISTMIFMFMMLYLFNGKNKIKRTVITTIIFSILVYVVFSKLLGVYLPVMPFIYI
ncbi:MAG: tripartite tricarboxylate transporter TctB family protein [Fusobacterium sp. JB020]|nr:tripartite tricarboxylate transporter TctB family protein [Fusobacterium sp. JB020]